MLGRKNKGKVKPLKVKKGIPDLRGMPIRAGVDENKYHIARSITGKYCIRYWYWKDMYETYYYLDKKKLYWWCYWEADDYVLGSYFYVRFIMPIFILPCNMETIKLILFGGSR